MKIRRLTPAILKKIIAEEKTKMTKQQGDSTHDKPTNKKTSLVEKRVRELTKLALLEARQKIRLKKIRRARELIKKSLK